MCVYKTMTIRLYIKNEIIDAVKGFMVRTEPIFLIIKIEVAIIPNNKLLSKVAHKLFHAIITRLTVDTKTS